MAKAYHIDLRKRVVEYALKRGNNSEAARTFGLHRNTVDKWCKLSEQNKLEYKMPDRNFRKIDGELFVKYVNNNNDLTLAEYAREFKVSANSIWSALKKLKITRKKNDTLFRKRRKAKR
jgi:transposase